MSSEPNGRPKSLSERLKQLDAAQSAEGMPEFDLGAAIRGGERRRRRRMVGGAAALAVGAGLAVAALFTGLVPGSLLADDRSTPAESVKEAGLVYAQRGDAVTISRAGETLGELTLVSADLDTKENGTVEVTVTSRQAFTLDPAEFVWSGIQFDQEPTQSGQEFQVDGTGPQTFRWTYDTVSEGELAWIDPATGDLAAAWNVGENTDPVPVPATQLWYLQRDDVVSVYRGTGVTATITAYDLVVSGSGATVQLKVTADDPSFQIRSDAFFWENADSDGGDHRPATGTWETFAAGEDQGETLLEFPKTSEGYLIWAPDSETVAGIWRTANAPEPS